MYIQNYVSFYLFIKERLSLFIDLFLLDVRT